MKEIDVDGAKIPIFAMGELIQPVLWRYNVGAFDPAIQDLVLSDINESVESNDLERMRMFLSSDGSRWIGTLQWAFIQPFPGREFLDRYEEWVEAKCTLLLAILRQTREEDYVIQHLLNYDDFCIEVLNWPFKKGVQFLIQVYELRGIDFFLFHYMGGQTDAHKDAALFDGARTVVRALREVQRVAESERVDRDINERQKRTVKIQESFIGPDYDPSSNLSAKLKIASEKFWVDYLSVPVWQGLLPDSRSELTDAFSTEYLLKSQVLSNWSNVSLLLCKVVEREVGRVLFFPWKPLLTSIDWTEPSGLPNSEAKRAQSRIQTLQMLKSVATKPMTAPTLGQLVFLAKFWNDRLMDSLTDVFTRVRREASSRLPNVDVYVEQVATILTEPVVNGGEKKSITEIRNSAAHPRADGDLDWERFSATLREVLGRPPKTLLGLLCVNMAALTNAQQDAGGNALPRVPQL
jgi:hypothetical protein